MDRMGCSLEPKACRRKRKRMISDSTIKSFAHEQGMWRLITNRSCSLVGSNETAPQVLELLTDVFVLGVNLCDELLLLALQPEYGGNQFFGCPAVELVLGDEGGGSGHHGRSWVLLQVQVLLLLL